jgi:NAD(P)-dependent dehydrogenase (short-subunit alcohol dehydrogenase family)
MQTFRGKIAAITGGGTGMGRELALQLVNEGCSVAICDVSETDMSETARLCGERSASGATIATFVADVSKEADLLGFAAYVREKLATDHVDLVFNNAGITGGGSIVDGNRAQWERIFNVCWFGVYYGTLAFLPLLLKSEDGRVINTSSLCGLWGSVGPGKAYSAYCAAKFAVRGFTEALINDFAANAPNIKSHVVVPGYIGTGIVTNSADLLGRDAPPTDMAVLRKAIGAHMAPEADIAAYTDEQLKAFAAERGRKFQENARTSASKAADIILAGIREDRWRILVGDDAEFLDRNLRVEPERIYTQEFYDMLVAEANWGS